MTLNAKQARFKDTVNRRRHGGKQGGLIVSASVSGSSCSDRALARNNVLYTWARHLTLSVSLRPGVHMGTSELSAGGKWSDLRLDRPLGLF